MPTYEQLEKLSSFTAAAAAKKKRELVHLSVGHSQSQGFFQHVQRNTYNLTCSYTIIVNQSEVTVVLAETLRSNGRKKSASVYVRV